jgi:dipeptidyl aminopeptidase/acylaminoacyl peptidase
VKDYRWAPGGQRIAFISEDESKDQATEEEGDEDDCPGLPKPEELTEGDAFTIQTFEFSPNGNEIVYEHRENSDIMSYATADSSRRWP